MAYIKYADFTQFYGSDLMDEETFNSLVNPACSKIDEITRFKVAEEGLNSLAPFIQELFKRACMAQCAYYGYYGLEVAYTGVAGLYGWQSKCGQHLSIKRKRRKKLQFIKPRSGKSA